MPRSNLPSNLATAVDLVRLRWPPQGLEGSRYQTLKPAQWTALAGLMHPKTSVTLTMWQQAVDEGFDLNEGAAWLVHMNRGDLVRPLAERFGFDWAAELNRLRAPGLGNDRPVNALSQALHQPNDREAGQAENDALRAPLVVAAWEAMGLDPTQRLRTPVALFAGVHTPVNTVLELPLNWLGVALACGAWEHAKRWMNDPRILADRAGLDQALFVWTVTAWHHKAPHDPNRNPVGLEPKNDSYWPKRLLAAGARVDAFPWDASEVRRERMQFSKGEPSTHTWAQSVPHYRWLPPAHRQAMETERASAPLWSTAHWAARNAALGYDKERHPLWHLLKADTDLWARLPDDEYGQSLLTTVMMSGEPLIKVGAPLLNPNARKARPQDWQGEAIVTRLVDARPSRTQDELLTALYLGVAQGLWGVLRCFTAAREQHPKSVPEQGLFADEELATLMDTLLVVAYPVEFCRYGAGTAPTDHNASSHTKNRRSKRGAASTSNGKEQPLGPEGDLRQGQNDDSVVNVWWTVEAPAFAGWLSTAQQDVWKAWCLEMAAALPNARFRYPVQTKDQSRETFEALCDVYIEQRDLVATMACDAAFERLRHHQAEPSLHPPRNRSRL